MVKTYYTPQELCNAVYCAVKNSPTPLSRLDICRAIGRKKSPHILDIIEQLFVGGWFTKTETTDKHGRKVFVYGVGRDVETGGACEQYQNA